MFPSHIPARVQPAEWQIPHDVPFAVSQFWQRGCVSENFKKLRDTIGLAKSLHRQMESLLLIKGADWTVEELDGKSSAGSLQTDAPSLSNPISTKGQDGERAVNEALRLVSEVIEAKRIDLGTQESLSLEAANSLVSTLRHQLLPFDAVTSQSKSWEERSMAMRLSNKMQKAKRNRLWRKRKRKRVAEMLCKVEKMKEIAKVKAKEERKRLESELELVLVVEKLQDLRSLRIQKLKKQGHFLPEEDDKFLEGVWAAVEEEERQAAAVANTGTAKDAIATAGESRLGTRNNERGVVDNIHHKNEAGATQEHSGKENVGNPAKDVPLTEPEGQVLEVQRRGGGYGPLDALPLEFYHYLSW